MCQGAQLNLYVNISIAHAVQVLTRVKFCTSKQERNICAKCCQSKEIVLSEQELALIRAKEAKEFETTLESMRERDRRAHLRKAEKEKEEERRLRREAADEAGSDVEGDRADGYESFDEDMDDDDDL